MALPKKTKNMPVKPKPVKQAGGGKLSAIAKIKGARR